MRTKNTCRYYCAVRKMKMPLNDYFPCSNFYKQKRKAIMFAESLYGKDNYIIVFWDFKNGYENKNK